MILKKIKQVLLGNALASDVLKEEKLNNFQSLAIFGSDAISSSVYASEEILLGLTVAGAILFSASLPITIAILSLIFIISLSYREIIHAYPQGGGVYNVAKKNLGELPGLIGSSSLLIDYIFTVAVSIAAGVAAITSALPPLFPYRVIIGIIVILFLTWTNLRGVRSSGRILSIPTYFFIFTIFIMIGSGLHRFFNGTLPIVQKNLNIVEPLGILAIIIILKAFSSGCAALTGIEAISNGIRAFKRPESKNAEKTLFRLAFLLSLIFIGIMFLAYQMKITPMSEETIVSQIAETLFGKTLIYFLIQIATFLILFLAANTAYADFPRVIALQAVDGYLPKQFFSLGSRLVFSSGVIALSFIAGLLLLIFQGRVHALVPLYSVGVFLGFSLSQLGMVFHWKKSGGFKKHFKNVSINLIGLFVTSIVFLIVFFSKFSNGAWILLPMIFLIVFTMKKIKKHYLKIKQELKIEKDKLQSISRLKDIKMVLLISEIDRRAVEATNFIKGFHPNTIQAFHLAFSEKSGEKLKQEWENLFPDIPIIIQVNKFREIIPSILEYFANLTQEWKGEIVAVVPMVIPVDYSSEYLHNRVSRKIIEAIREDERNNVRIVEVPIKI